MPGKNDSDDEIAALSAWLAGLSTEIPLHLSRYFPRYHFHEEATPISKIYRLAEIARKNLKFVYEGNC